MTPVSVRIKSVAARESVPGSYTFLWPLLEMKNELQEFINTVRIETVVSILYNK